MPRMLKLLHKRVTLPLHPHVRYLARHDLNFKMLLLTKPFLDILNFAKSSVKLILRSLTIFSTTTQINPSYNL